MEHYWLNDGNADDKGIFTAHIKDDDGKVVSTFKGASVKEVADQLLQSNAASSAEFQRLKKNRTPDRAAVQPSVTAPKPLSADDHFRIASELTDANPDKAVAAVQEIVTRSVGATPQQIGKVLTQVEAENLERFYTGEVNAFLKDTPDYYPDPGNANKDRMLKLLQLKQLDITRNNLSIVYDELHSQGLLIPRPAVGDQQEAPAGRTEAKPSQEPNSPPPARARQVASTGFRSSDANGQRPPASAPPKYTRRQIAEMSAEEYRDKMRDPGFRKIVDGLGK